MPTRVSVCLAFPLLLALGSCAASRSEARIREQLDAYSIAKPLAEVWPEALRHASDRGFDLVGKDRAVLGQEEQGTLGKILSAGHDTRTISATQWRAETAANGQRLRYRILGTATGASSCRIQFVAVQAGDPLGGSETRAREYRDVELELDFIEKFDAERAQRMSAAAR